MGVPGGPHIRDVASPSVEQVLRRLFHPGLTVDREGGHHDVVGEAVDGHDGQPKRLGGRDHAPIPRRAEDEDAFGRHIHQPGDEVCGIATLPGTGEDRLNEGQVALLARRGVGGADRWLPPAPQPFRNENAHRVEVAAAERPRGHRRPVAQFVGNLPDRGPGGVADVAMLPHRQGSGGGRDAHPRRAGDIRQGHLGHGCPLLDRLRTQA